MVLYNRFIKKNKPFKSKVSFFLFVILILQVTSIFGQAAEITVDGKFDDWTPNLATYTDGADNPGGIDLLNFQVTNDENYLFIKFTLNKAICIANNLVGHQLWLCIDTDNNPNTGYHQQTGYGTELAINFIEHYAWFNIPTPNIKIPFSKIGLQVLPTVTSSTFEVAIDRHSVPNGIDSLFTNDTIRILIKDNLDGDKMPNEGDVFYYTFDNTPVNTFTPIDLNKENPEYIRVVDFNIFQNAGWGSYPNLTNIQSLLTAINADIYCFQECEANTAEEIKAFMDAWLPLKNSDGWYVAKQNNIITCSKWPFLQKWNLLAKLATLIDLPDSYPKDLLIINAHLSYGMANDKRQNQVDEFASFVLDAKSKGGVIDLPDSTPIVFLGDMNFVGYAQQPITAQTGDIQNVAVYGAGDPLDWDNTDLADAASLHSDQKMAYTWRTLKDDVLDFPPGRLDYQFYTDAVLNKEKGFILQTGVMSDDRLALYHLNREDSHQVSDHLPHVVDYSFVESPNSISNPGLLKVNFYPNPATNYIKINTDRKLQSAVLVDLFGRKVLVLPKGSSRMDLSGLPSGVYFLDMKVNGVRKIQKVLLNR